MINYTILSKSTKITLNDHQGSGVSVRWFCKARGCGGLLDSSKLMYKFAGNKP